MRAGHVLDASDLSGFQREDDGLSGEVAQHSFAVVLAKSLLRS